MYCINNLNYFSFNIFILAIQSDPVTFLYIFYFLSRAPPEIICDVHGIELNQNRALHMYR